jgi:penicillin V acylase-like amidase (Ntn superfamily)
LVDGGARPGTAAYHGRSLAARPRTVADHKRKLYFFESALTPNVFWVDLKEVDFAPQTGKVMKLDLGKDQRNVFAGNASKQFKETAPFKFQGL